MLNRYRGKRCKTEVATPGVFYIVFVLPIIASVIFGSFVMAEVLKEPERELGTLQSVSSDLTFISTQVKILGLERVYSTNVEVNIQVSIDDPVFDCGDLYVTIYDISKTSKKVVTQSGFFHQCFDKNNLILPVDDEFSQIIESPGNYEIVIEIFDKQNKKTTSSSAEFTVK
ncbi:MAG: hypothetical protein NPMRTH4_390003 [Nitrosopumilales archaeon]|nr:MAG: hypothetical protein NPMRTH4_390003 [Nitrosopumilales archaeon]